MILPKKVALSLKERKLLAEEQSAQKLAALKESRPEFEAEALLNAQSRPGQCKCYYKITGYEVNDPQASDPNYLTLRELWTTENCVAGFPFWKKFANTYSSNQDESSCPIVFNPDFTDFTDSPAPFRSYMPFNCSVPHFTTAFPVRYVGIWQTLDCLSENLLTSANLKFRIACTDASDCEINPQSYQSEEMTLEMTPETIFFDEQIIDFTGDCGCAPVLAN